MCRMIAAIGEFNNADIIAAIKNMSCAKNSNHEYTDEEPLLTHFDGWGCAYKEEHGWQTYKSASSVYDEEEFPFKDLKTSALVVHARAATVGEENLANTHPFVNQNTGLILFHNGTIQLPPTPTVLTPKGETDSEKLFLCIAERVLEGKTVVQAIDEELSLLTEFWGANLFVLSDSYLYATCLHKITPRYYTMYVGVTDTATFIASEMVPIPEVTWTPINNKRLLKVSLEDASFSVHEFPQWP